MPATVLSASPTAWTTLVTNLAPVEESIIGNRMVTLSVNPADLSVNRAAPDVNNLPDEIRQIVMLAQSGFGAALGTNKRIGHWAAAVLLRDMLTAYVNQGVPR